MKKTANKKELDQRRAGRKIRVPCIIWQHLTTFSVAQKGLKGVKLLKSKRLWIFKKKRLIRGLNGCKADKEGLLLGKNDSIVHQYRKQDF